MFDAFEDMLDDLLNGLGTVRRFDEIPLPPSALRPYEESYTPPESDEGICSMLRGRDTEALTEWFRSVCRDSGGNRIVISVSDPKMLCSLFAAAGEAGATLIPAVGTSDAEIRALAERTGAVGLFCEGTGPAELSGPHPAAVTDDVIMIISDGSGTYRYRDSTIGIAVRNLIRV